MRYWGKERDSDLARCSMCSRDGHTANACPSRTCKHCSAVNEHFSSACPSVLKCQKCKERGHNISECTSKLSRSLADGFICDICSGPHVEEKCSWVWRSFKPDESKIRKADRLIVSCYECGSSQHWGDDCLTRPKKKTSNCDTFSARFANQFVRPTAAAPTANGINIRGRAQRTVFPDVAPLDDSSNFYGRKVETRQPPRQNINVSIAGFRAGGQPQAQSYNNVRPPDHFRAPLAESYDPPPMRPIDEARARYARGGDGGGAGNGGRGGGGRGGGAQFGASNKARGAGRGGRGGRGGFAGPPARKQFY